MNVRDVEGKTIMDRLIAKLPEAAMVIIFAGWLRSPVVACCKITQNQRLAVSGCRLTIL